MLAVAAAILMILARVYMESRDAFIEAEKYTAANDYENAAEYYRRSVRWYIPFVSKSEDSLRELLRIAVFYENTKKDNQEALRVYRMARSAIMLVRSLWTPFKEDLGFVNDKIATLMALQDTGGREGFDGKKAHYLSQLYRDFAPDPAMSLGAALTFLLWIAFMVIFIWKGFTSDGKFRKEGLVWGAAAAMMLVSWILFVRFA